MANSEEADFPVLAHNDHLTYTTDNDDLMADGDNVNLPLKANIDKVTARHYSISLNCDLEKVGYIQSAKILLLPPKYEIIMVTSNH